MNNPDIFKSWSDEVEEKETNVRKATKEKMKSDSSRKNLSSRKKAKLNTKSDTDKSRKLLEIETDPVILQRRQKQIDYGKNTVGYHNYLQEVPLDQRGRDHPKTPDKFIKYSRRSWDTLVKIWRKKLHGYDTDAVQADTDSDDDSSIGSGHKSVD